MIENESVRQKTGKEYYSEYLLTKEFKGEDEFGNEIKLTAVEVINAVDQELDQFAKKFGSLDTRFVTKVLLAKLVRMSTLLNRRLNQLARMLESDAEDKGFINAEGEEVVDLLGVVETSINFLPIEAELNYAEVLANIRKNFDNEGGMATPEQLREHLYDLITAAVDEDTKEKIGLGDIMIPMGDTKVSILDLYVFLRDPARQQYFSGYAERFGEIFAYANWRLGARKHETLLFENYTDAEKLRDELTASNMPTRDATVYDVLKGGMEDANDAFPTPFPERARAATLLYENIHIIDLVANIDKDPKRRARRLKKLNLAADATNQQINTAKIALLKKQPSFGFLTNDEAQFLLDNVKNFMPWERHTADQIDQTRLAIQIFAAADTIRQGSFKNGNTDKYSQSLRGLRVKVVNGQAQFFRTDAHGQDQAITASTDPDLYNHLVEMKKYGARAEGGAYSMFYPTLQAATADTGAIGYMKPLVWMAQHITYSTRYLHSDYKGLGPDPFMAKHVPRLIQTWYAQMLIKHPLSGSQVAFSSLLGLPELDFSQHLQMRSQVTAEQAVRIADNLKRAIDFRDLIEEGIFSDKFVGPLQNFHMAKDQKLQDEKIQEGFMKAYKVLKYEIDMIPLDAATTDADLSQLTTDSSTRELMLVYLRDNKVDSAKRVWIEDQIMRLIQSELIKIIRSNAPLIYSAMTRNLNSNSQDGDIKRLILEQTDLKNDLLVLKQFLFARGRIRTKGRRTQDWITQGLVFIADSVDPYDLTDENKLFEGVAGRVFVEAVRVALSKNYVTEDDLVDPFDLYVQ